MRPSPRRITFIWMPSMPVHQRNQTQRGHAVHTPRGTRPKNGGVGNAAQHGNTSRREALRLSALAVGGVAVSHGAFGMLAADRALFFAQRLIAPRIMDFPIAYEPTAQVAIVTMEVITH